MKTPIDSLISFESFKISLNSKEYSIIIALFPNAITIQLLFTNLGIIESAKVFTFNEFCEMSPGFHFCQTIKQIYDFLWSLFNDKKVELQESIDEYKLILMINIEKITSIPIVIPKNTNDSFLFELPHSLIYNQEPQDKVIVENNLIENKIALLEEQFKNERMHNRKFLKKIKRRINIIQQNQDTLNKKYQSLESKIKLLAQEENINPLKQRMLNYLLDKKEEHNLTLQCNGLMIKNNNNYITKEKKGNEKKNKVAISQILILSNKDSSILLDWISPIHKLHLNLKYNPIIGEDTYEMAFKSTKNVSPLLILIETSDGCRFGIFTKIPQKNIYFKKDRNSFIFSLDSYFKHIIDKQDLSIYFDAFNNWNLFIFTLNDNFMTNTCNTIKPEKADMDVRTTLYSFNKGKDYFRVKHCLVYSVDFLN